MSLANDCVEWVRRNPDTAAKLPDYPETYTVRDVPVRETHFANLRSKGVIERVEKKYARGEVRSGSTYYSVWRTTETAEQAKERYCDRDSDKTMPCDCYRDGFKNLENGGFACVVCGEEFERGELNV